MMPGAAYRICRLCGAEYRASHPACPGCGATPFTRRQAFASAGPRLTVLICAVFFVVMTIYGVALPSAYYEKYSGYFFWMPRWASIAVGLAGSALFLLLTLKMRAGKKSDGRD